MKSKVVGESLLDTFKKVLGLIDKGLDSLAKLGMDVRDKKEIDGGCIYTVYCGDDDKISFKVKITDSEDDEEMVNVHCKDEKNHKEKKYADVDPNKIEDVIRKFCEECYGVATFAVNSSCKFSVQLKRVCGSKYDSIQMTAINCSSNISCTQVLADINTLLDSAEIVDKISETPIAFEVVDDGCDLDVNEISDMPESSMSESFKSILTEAYKLYSVLLAIHWNSKGEHFNEIHGVSQNYYYNITSQIDALAELCVEYGSAAPSPASIFKTFEDDIDTTNGFDVDTGYKIISDQVKNYLSCIECFYCNFPHDVQSELDNWIRDWNHEIDFLVARHYA